jgi:L-asparaginase/Glu-tRNA(Gln) amidotransferase subunit D
VGWNAATVDDAINTAHAQMDKKNVAYGNPQKYQGVVFKGCGVPHGAVAGVRDNQIPNDQDIVVVTLAFGKGASLSEAESNALASCRQLQNSRGRTCEVLQSW